MRYRTPHDLRAALEQRLKTESREGSTSLNVLRRRVIYERILARLNHAQPGTWVVKGGCALDIRMPDRTRATEDLDLGLRHDRADGAWVLEQLRGALDGDPDGDFFIFYVLERKAVQPQSPVWRFSIRADLDGREFGTLKVDVTRRDEGLNRTDQIDMSFMLESAGFSAHPVELVNINRHAAEKFHALTRSYGTRPSSRVRDLVDLVLMIEFDLIANDVCSEQVRRTFDERNTHDLPDELDPPPTLRDNYESMAPGLGIEADSFDAAVALVRSWWDRNLRRRL